MGYDEFGGYYEDGIYIQPKQKGSTFNRNVIPSHSEQSN
jgi:hypothetical protein